METLLKTILLGVLIAMIYYGLSAFINLFLSMSPLTPEGMEWQKAHNPEYMKADALRRMADLQEREARDKKNKSND